MYCQLLYTIAFIQSLCSMCQLKFSSCPQVHTGDSNAAGFGSNIPHMDAPARQPAGDTEGTKAERNQPLPSSRTYLRAATGAGDLLISISLYRMVCHSVYVQVVNLKPCVWLLNTLRLSCRTREVCLAPNPEDCKGHTPELATSADVMHGPPGVLSR